MNKEKLILIDFDGTLVDTFNAAYHFVKTYYSEMANLDLSEEKFREIFVHNPLDTICHETETTLDEYKDAHIDNDLFKTEYQTSEIFDGMDEIMKDLSENHTLALVTSSFAEMYMPIIEAYELDTTFSAFLGADMGVDKTQKIQQVMEEFGSDESDTIFISDTVGDIMEAKEAGVKTVAVTWGFSSTEDLQNCEPDHIFSDPQELFKLLDS